jgi:hypothetical protein
MSRLFCTQHYTDCLIKVLNNKNPLGDLTFTSMQLIKEGIFGNHMSVLCSIGITTIDKKLDFTSLY